MRNSLLVSPLLLVASGALAGWVAHGVLSSKSLESLQRQPIAECETGSSSSAGPTGSQHTEDSNALLPDWYEAGFELASRVNHLEELLGELQTRDEDARVLVASAIERASERDLIDIVGAVTHLDAQELEEFHDVRRFAQRLTEVAWDESAEAGLHDDVEHAVDFSHSANPADLQEGYDAMFVPETNRIYAAISLDGFEGDRVIVKWFNRDSMKIHTLRSFRYGREDRGVWAFVDRESGWESGQYRVHVYTQNDEMDLIASGGYVVE